MLLPFDTTLSYWAMAVPQFEWQPESSADPQATFAGPACGACIETSGQSVPTAGAAPAGCDDAGDAAAGESCRPNLRLVMTGMQWVLVPYWSPRENAYWNLMTEAARDTDIQKNEADLRQSKRPAPPAAPADEVATGGASQ